MPGKGKKIFHKTLIGATYCKFIYTKYLLHYFFHFLALCDMNRGENNPILFFCSRVFQASCLLFYRTVKPQVPLLVCPIF